MTSSDVDVACARSIFRSRAISRNHRDGQRIGHSIHSSFDVALLDLRERTSSRDVEKARGDPNGIARREQTAEQHESGAGCLRERPCRLWSALPRQRCTTTVAGTARNAPAPSRPARQYVDESLPSRGRATALRHRMARPRSNSASSAGVRVNSRTRMRQRPRPRARRRSRFAVE